MDRIVNFGSVKVLAVAPDGPLLAEERDAGDFLGLGWSHEAEMLAIPVTRLGPDFLRLRTRLLGDVVQKFVNYRMRLAVVGDISGDVAGSDALRDYVYEANKGKAIWFVDDLAELEARLAA